MLVEEVITFETQILRIRLVVVYRSQQQSIKDNDNISTGFVISIRASAI